MGSQASSSRDPRKGAHYKAAIPATIRIATSSGTVPFRIKEVTISSVSESALGLILTVTTDVTHEDLIKTLARRRGCQITCRLPERGGEVCIGGTIVGVQPIRTSRGLQVRFGVNVSEAESKDLAALMTHLEGETKSS